MAITLDEFNTIKNITEIGQKISIDDFVDKTDRTLLYGYTVERESFHVYLHNNEICYVIYSNPDFVVDMDNATEWIPENLIPSKRVYPESMDKEFFVLLQKMGVSIPFTTYDKTRYERVKDEQYHGLALLKF